MQHSSILLVRWLFSRIVSFCFFCAFVSISFQMIPLYGSEGILPIHQFLLDTRSVLGTNLFQYIPSIFLLNDSDCFLSLIPALGIIFSSLAFCGIFTSIFLFLSYVLYLSIVAVGQDFMGFQWDSLLLETAFLAILWNLPRLHEKHPWQIKFRVQSEPSYLVLWLIRFLIFKLMFLSGLVKILSADPSWQNLTAMQYHYLTQPLPTPLAWLLDKNPILVQKISTAVVLFIELVLPFFIFFSQRMRNLVAYVFILFQILILLSGNYTFFNILTIAIALCLFDDHSLVSVCPRSIKLNLQFNFSYISKKWQESFLTLPMSIFTIFISIIVFFSGIGFKNFMPEPFLSGIEKIEVFRICNNYGLFAVMTTKRCEIIIEGSMDGKNWYTYEFPCKPGQLNKSPCIVAPFQPRLDWQMWFAAFSEAKQNVWFINLMYKLLSGSNSVSTLFEHDPFQNKAPVYIRAQLYEYKYSDLRDLFKGIWWTRKYKYMYLSPISLEH